jgi:two-component system phosphate regulon sensor histidine kinase PhoR
LAVDSVGHLITLNRAAAALIETERNEAVGKNLTTVIRNADLRRFMQRALESSQPVEDDITFLGHRSKILQVRGTALHDVRGNSIGAVIVLNDVTHTRNLESVRRDFVANVSHELKTPISSIKGFVETLIDGAVNNPADADRFLKIIAKQADRLHTIIDDLLSLSRIEQSEQSENLQLEEGKLLDVLATVVNDYQSRAAEKNISLNIDCDEALTAKYNAHLLEQAVGNLVDNALKYSEPEHSIEISGYETQENTVITVHDHGVGIDSEHLPRLFERFYRVDKARSRKLGGTGLGLAIVKHIVQAHKGRVEVASTVGQGSTFTIFLPK